MAEPSDPGRRWKVLTSRKVGEAVLQLLRRAKREGRGEGVVAALRQIHERLSHDPNNFGEPLYRLTSLKFTVRDGAIRPVAVSFAVHEEEPIVLLRVVKLLTQLR